MESFTFHDLGRIDYADALKVQTDAFETLLHKSLPLFSYHKPQFHFRIVWHFYCKRLQ